MYHLIGLTFNLKMGKIQMLQILHALKISGLPDSV